MINDDENFIFFFNLFSFFPCPNSYPVSLEQEKTIKLKHVTSTDGIVDIKRKFSKFDDDLLELES